ncbi:MAG: terpene cyclase/mutase family protein [Gemmataceae bacterium]|nr:terpene cyclase/mutase family protein [Gemmataceae bacterium]
MATDNDASRPWYVQDEPPASSEAPTTAPTKRSTRKAHAWRPVVAVPPLPCEDDATFEWRRLMPAWIVSGAIHVLVLLLFLFVTVQTSSASSGTELGVIETKIDDDVRDKNLINDEIGDDPELPLNYNVDRIEEVSVPGPANVEESVGIPKAPDTPPINVTPPPGFSQGTGGGIDNPALLGSGNLIGMPGGYAGGKLVPGGFGGRSGSTREKMLREGGGNMRSEAAVAAGLKWLALHQADDGHWGMHDFHQHGRCNCNGVGHNSDVASTGLALLPFLGAGETQRGAAANSLYAKNVDRGLRYLMAKQGSDGKLGDGYSHAIAAIALCEAYGMTADPSLRRSAQSAINACVAWQGANGGFRYTPKSDGDTSVSGWHIQALKSGHMAGLNVPVKTWRGINKYLDLVGGGNYGEVYGYTSPVGSPSMTAVGLLCRQYTTWGPRALGMQRGIEELQKRPPGGKDIYYYYYATQVVHNVGGPAWEQWNPKMRDSLVERQDMGTSLNRPHQKGSWSPNGDALDHSLGRLGVTSLSLLTLEVYYRHLPLYRKDLGTDKEEALRNGM